MACIEMKEEIPSSCDLRISKNKGLGFHKSFISPVTQDVFLSAKKLQLRMMVSMKV